MKKLVLSMICVMLVFTLSGCFGQRPQFENIDTAKVIEPDSIAQKDYKDNLDGLIKYFQALNYLPVNTEPTVMLSEVIGAKNGRRYIFTVNGSQTVAELYEYDLKNLDSNAQRVIADIKENGSFHVFDQEGVDKDITYKATLSDNGKYMMIYRDDSNNDANVNRTKLVEEALKGFYSSKESKTDKTEKEESPKTESSATESATASKAEESSKASA